MKKSKPYGAWPSEIDANSASKALTELNYLQSFDEVLFWTENRAESVAVAAQEVVAAMVAAEARSRACRQRSSGDTACG